MRVLAKVVVSLAVLTLLLWLTDAQAVWARLKGADWRWFGAVLVSLTALTFLMALRWRLVARKLGLDLGQGRAVREYYIAQLVNMVLPGGVAGDVGRAIRVRRDGDLVQAAQSVAAERIVGQSLIFTVMWIGFTAALLIPGGLFWPSWGWWIIGGMAFVPIITLAFARHTGPVGDFLRLILRCLTDLRIVSVSIFIVALLIASLYATARATGTVVPPEGWFTVLPLILTSMLIPLSIGGWGWREGAAAALFPLIGAQSSAGVAMGIGYGAMLTLAAVPALMFLPDLGRQSDTGGSTTPPPETHNSK